MSNTSNMSNMSNTSNTTNTTNATNTASAQLDKYFDQSNNLTNGSFSHNGTDRIDNTDVIIQQLRSYPILMKFLPTIGAYTEYCYKGRSDKKESFDRLLNSVNNLPQFNEKNDNKQTNYAFIEIRGNGACLYNSIIASLLLQKRGLTINHLTHELVPYDSIDVENIYNKQITNNIVTNYFVVSSMLEDFGKQYLTKQFGFTNSEEVGDIALYGFTKSLNEPIQNFQQLGTLISNLFNVVIVLLSGEINAGIDDKLEYVCIAPQQCTNITTIKQNLESNIWHVSYIINTSVHYNLVFPYTDLTQIKQIKQTQLLLHNESKMLFSKLCDIIRFV